MEPRWNHGLITQNRVTLLKGTEKNEVMKELCQKLASDIECCDGNLLEEEIFKREALMSTGIGLGIAVPHVRLKNVKELSVAVGISRKGIVYGSLDDESVHIMVLIVAPEDAHEAYIKLLAEVVLMLKNEDFRKQLIAANSDKEIYELLKQH